MPSSSNPPADRSGQTIDSGYIQLIKVLGSGGFGTVYQARTTGSRKNLAVKVVTRRKRTRHLEQTEVELHSRVSLHPNIVTLHRWFLDASSLYMVFDAHLGGDLYSAIGGRALYFYQDERVKDALLQVLDAVEFCHDQGVYHRDLKPENFLLSADGSRIVLTDFGLATTNAVSTSFRVGTDGYMAPEVINVDVGAKNYSPRLGDIWSFGVLAVALLTGHRPWHAAAFSDKAYTAFQRDPASLRMQLPLSHAAVSLAALVLRADAAARPSIPFIRRRIARTKTFFMRPDGLAHKNPVVRELVASTFERQVDAVLPAGWQPPPTELLELIGRCTRAESAPPALGSQEQKQNVVGPAYATPLTLELDPAFAVNFEDGTPRAPQPPIIVSCTPSPDDASSGLATPTDSDASSTPGPATPGKRAVHAPGAALMSPKGGPAAAAVHVVHASAQSELSRTFAWYAARMLHAERAA